MTAREALRRGLLSLPLTRCVASFRGGNMQSVQVGWMKKTEGRKSWVDEKIGWIKKCLMRARDAPLLAAPSMSVSISLSPICSDMQGAWFHN